MLEGNNINLLVDSALSVAFMGDDTSAIKKCISGYSKRDSFTGQLQYMMYRMVNAAKAAFGQSDWQKSRRAITERAFKIAPIPLSVFVSKENFDSVSDGVLRVIVAANNVLPRTSPEFIEVTEPLLKKAMQLYATNVLLNKVVMSSGFAMKLVPVLLPIL